MVNQVLESTFESLLTLSEWPDDGLHGRRKIYTNKKTINASNVVEVLSKALGVHRVNQSECKYLYEYYLGKQDIRLKEKEVRPEINNKVEVNRANEIVTFKSGFFLSDPIQYVSKGGDDSVSEKVNRLNDYMTAEDKVSIDKETLDWMHICGVSPKIILADRDMVDDGSPFYIETLNPMEAFVIYFSGVGHRPMAGVLIQVDENDETYYCVYTNSEYFEIKGNQIITRQGHTYGDIPIVEYENGFARMGAFEMVVPLLNAINTVESNRVDGIQEFVNAFDVFQNCELEDGTYAELAKGGMAIQINGRPGMEAKVYRIASELNQTNTQTLVDDLYDSLLTICGMPNRNGGSSTSDTGTATIMRDGWAEAESRAEDTEKSYNRGERRMLRIALKICRDMTDLDLRLSDIKIEHTRNNLSNMQSRMQVLCEGLNNQKIHPKIPWIVSGMPNAEEWYRISMEYYEQEQEKLNEQLMAETQRGTGLASSAANSRSSAASSTSEGSSNAEQ